MAQKPLYEISRRSIVINKCEEPSFSWQNSVLTVRTQKGLNLLKFSHDLQCMDKKIDWSITYISCPKTSPASSLFKSKFMRGPISNFDITGLMVDPALWPHNKQIMEEMASIVAFEWSPPDFMHNNEGVVAVLNNVGNIELYGPKSCGFKSILNISAVIEENYTDNLKANFPRNIEQLKNAVYAVETSALCWGVKHNNYFTFVTAQKSGDIYFWQLEDSETKLNIKEIAMLQTDSGEIVSIQWIPLESDTFLLIFTNVSGQLFVYKYQWDSDNVKIVKWDCLWSYKDKMAIKHLKYSMMGDKIVLILSKHRHLVILMIDRDCNKISEYVNNINDYRITVISETSNEFFVATVNCNVYKINITLTGNDLDVKLAPITIKENFVSKDLFGMHFSMNSIICAIGVVDRKVMYRKESLTLDIILLSHEVSHEKEISLLLKNPTRKLTGYWDCIEMLRYKTMKLKILPSIDYNEHYRNGSNDLYKMKVYYILVVLYDSLEKILKNNSKEWLPETSVELVKEKILALHAESLVKKLYKKSQKNDHLNNLEIESVVGAQKYLKYFSQKYNVELTELVSSDLTLMKLDDQYEYTCQCCDDKIVGFSCINGHLNMFCALTFTPIESDKYLICNGCGVLARIELLPEKPMCVFCDQYFNNYLLPS